MCFRFLLCAFVSVLVLSLSLSCHCSVTLLCCVITQQRKVCLLVSFVYCYSLQSLANCIMCHAVLSLIACSVFIQGFWHVPILLLLIMDYCCLIWCCLHVTPCYRYWRQFWLALQYMLMPPAAFTIYLICLVCVERVWWWDFTHVQPHVRVCRDW